MEFGCDRKRGWEDIMKKRVLSLMLCGLMMVSLLAGCGAKEEPAADAEDRKSTRLNSSHAL